jgi:uncharacterized membrane protein (DUF2068 family)
MFEEPHPTEIPAGHTASTTATAVRPVREGLIWIGLMKLGKSLLFLTIGIGAIQLLHRDMADLILDAASALKFDPESHFVSVVLDQTAVIDDSRLRVISLATFFYSALALAEGIGLVMQKEWAEYFTLFLTGSFLPFEAYEIFRHSTEWKWLIAVTNVAIVVYLIWVLRENRRTARAARAVART